MHGTLPRDEGAEGTSTSTSLGSSEGAGVTSLASPARIPSSMVHELRTPLTAIHGYAQLLKRSPTDSAMGERAVDVILRETVRLGDLLKQLSEVAEIDSGPLTIAPGRANATDVARDVAEHLGKQGGSHEVVVDGESVEGQFDPRRLAQLLAHLIDNAIKYSPEGGRITVSIERAAGTVHVSVTDPGIGIPVEEAERVYERFARASNVQQANARGLGLGLYVSREIARQAGGRVWHEPATPSGTVFHLTIPDAPPPTSGAG